MGYDVKENKQTNKPKKVEEEQEEMLIIFSYGLIQNSGKKGQAARFWNIEMGICTVTYI